MTRFEALDFFREGRVGARVLVLRPVPPLGDRRAEAAADSGVLGEPLTRGGARPPEGRFGWAGAWRRETGGGGGGIRDVGFAVGVG